MILNNDITASTKLGVTNNVTLLDNLKNLKDKLLTIQFSKTTWIMVVGGCVVLIVERKIRYKPKTYKFNFKGGK